MTDNTGIIQGTDVPIDPNASTRDYINRLNGRVYTSKQIIRDRRSVMYMDIYLNI